MMESLLRMNDRTEEWVSMHLFVYSVPDSAVARRTAAVAEVGSIAAIRRCRSEQRPVAADSIVGLFAGSTVR